MRLVYLYGYQQRYNFLVWNLDTIYDKMTSMTSMKFIASMIIFGGK